MAILKLELTEDECNFLRESINHKCADVLCDTVDINKTTEEKNKADDKYSIGNSLRNKIYSEVFK